MDKYAIKLETRQVAEPDFPYNREKLDTCSTVVAFCKALQDSDVEKFLILHLNSSNILNCIQIFPGTVNYTIVPLREIIKVALLSSSINIILVHNHPSGNLTFSEQDITLTRDLIQISKIMNITILDHILIGGLNYQSMREKEPSMF